MRRAAVMGARALPGDWKVEIETDLPDVVPLHGAAMLAPPGAAPSMEASAGLNVNEGVVTIPQMDSSLLQVGPRHMIVTLVFTAGLIKLVCCKVIIMDLSNHVPGCCHPH